MVKQQLRIGAEAPVRSLIKENTVMIVRKIRPEEYKRVAEFCALAFQWSFEESALAPEALLEKIQKNPESRQDLHWDWQWAAFADDDRTMMSTFTVIPYQVHFDGHVLPMAGIGGVATLPEYRRQGGIRACFEKALPDMYERGMALSYLYPFSTVFYRKFGYELGCERDLYKIRLEGMPAFEANGTFRLLEPGSELGSDIRQVYDAFASRYNLMTCDDDIEYDWVEKANPFRDVAYTYLYRSADGTPKGVLTYKPIVDHGQRILDCTERFWFSDVEGFKALIHLLLRLKADHSHAQFFLPTDVQLGQIIPEWSFGNVERQRQAHGMVRVVNAVDVLRSARMRGTGDLTIELHDDQIQQNNGCFRVAFENGTVTAVEKTEAAPDIVLSIQDFSRLICGRYDMSDLHWLPGVKLLCSPEKAARVFYRKPMYINRPF